jgi:hypothetical protein
MSKESKSVAELALMNPWMLVAKPYYEFASHATETACRTCSEVGKNFAGFASRRLKAEMSLPSRLMACRSPEDVQRTYADFYRTMFDDYQDEFQRLWEFNREAGRNLTEVAERTRKLAA